MPPTSKVIYEEGAQIKSFKLVRRGVYDRKGLLRHLCEEPAKYPGCSGTRCLRDVESDLQAQVAANQKGINLIHGLVAEWGLETVQAVGLCSGSIPMTRSGFVQLTPNSLAPVHGPHSRQC